MDDIRDDHLTLRDLLVQLDRTASEERARSDGSLESTFDALASHLVKHFRREEASDLYLLFPSRFPDLAARLAELKVEHGKLIELLVDAQGAAARLEEARSDLSSLVTILVEQLRAHEQTEAEILARAYAAE